MRPHVLLNPRIRFPLLRVTLISACVEVGIRKQGRHLSNKSRKKPVGTFARWIHGRTLRRIFTADQFRIADKPRFRMAWHIELRDNPDTAVTSVRNNLSHFVLRVIKAAGGLLL